MRISNHRVFQVFLICFPHTHLCYTDALQHWNELLKEARQNPPVRENPAQGTHFRKSFFDPPCLQQKGHTVPCTLIPVMGTQGYIADIWDSNQETYFSGIEYPLSHCSARTVGKLELWHFFFFKKVSCPASHEILQTGLESAIHPQSYSLLQWKTVKKIFRVLARMCCHFCFLQRRVQTHAKYKKIKALHELY